MVLILFRFTVLLVSFVCCAVFLNDRLAAVNNSGNHPVLYCFFGHMDFISFSSKLQFLLYVENFKALRGPEYRFCNYNNF